MVIHYQQWPSWADGHHWFPPRSLDSANIGDVSKTVDRHLTTYATLAPISMVMVTIFSRVSIYTLFRYISFVLELHERHTTKVCEECLTMVDSWCRWRHQVVAIQWKERKECKCQSKWVSICHRDTLSLSPSLPPSLTLPLPLPPSLWVWLRVSSSDYTDIAFTFEP